MKKIPKKLMDSLIHVHRLYWKDGDRELITAMHSLCFEIQRWCGLDWLSVHNFVSSIVQQCGLSPNADNETIYEALKLFGWEIVDENQESKSL